MKNLIEKRNTLIKEYDELKAKVEAEKRSAFNTEERTRANEIKLAIEDLDSQISIEKDMVAKRNIKLDDIFAKEEGKEEKQEKRNYVNEFRSFLNGDRSNGEKFTIPFTETRATITTSSNSHVVYTDSHSPLSINDSELVLDKIGVPTFYFDSGSQDMPSISQITATFGTEDNSVSDQTLTSAKVTLAPTFVSASLEVSKKWLKSSKPENIAALMAELKFAVDKAVEKRTIDSMNSLTAAVSTGATVSFYSGCTVMEGSLIGAPTAFIFSRTGIQASKNKKVGTDQRMVNQDGTVIGYPALRSSLQTQAAYGYLVDAKALAKAYWGEGVTIEAIQGATEARKGNILLIASALADGSYLDANKVAVAKNVTSWT